MLPYVISYIFLIVVTTVFCLYLYRRDKEDTPWFLWMMVSFLFGIFWPLLVLGVIALKIMGVKE
jgi:hypothetical protein